MNSNTSSVRIGDEYRSMLRAAGLDSYDAVMGYSAGEPLAKPGLGDRERIRFTLNDAQGGAMTLYLKRYAANPPAEIEWNAIEVVRAAGVPTMAAVAKGIGRAGGFVIVTAVPGDALSRRFDELIGRYGRDVAAMNRLAERLGDLAGRLHRAGLSHRDFYACHIFCDDRDGDFRLHLIDLARVRQVGRRRWRWWAKDLAQLKSSLPDEWAQGYWPALVAAYVAGGGCSLPIRARVAIRWRTARLRWLERRRSARQQREAPSTCA